MRVEAYSQVQQLYQSTKSRKTEKASGSRITDQVQISGAGHDYQMVKKALESVPDVREDVTASIKSRIDSGTYSVDEGSFAAKLLEKYREMR